MDYRTLDTAVHTLPSIGRVADTFRDVTGFAVPAKKATPNEVLPFPAPAC
jgi:hypothetical protein